MSHFTVDGKPVSYSSWAAELSAFFEDVAEDPREQHEREDFEQRHADFIFAPIPSSGREGATAAITPGGGPVASELSDSTDARRANGGGGVVSPLVHVTPVESWETYAWRLDDVA